jgi:hypothetical protein
MNSLHRYSAQTDRQDHHTVPTAAHTTHSKHLCSVQGVNGPAVYMEANTFMNMDQAYFSQNKVSLQRKMRNEFAN